MKFIPAMPRGFCGRDTELRELKERLPEQKLILIAGLGGIGKTALAAAFANYLENTEEHREKNIWVRCRTGWNCEDMLAAIVQHASDLTGDKKTAKLKKISSDDVVALLDCYSLNLFLDNFQLIDCSETEEFIVHALEFLKTGRIIITSRQRLMLEPQYFVDICEKRLKGIDEEHCAVLAESLLEAHGFTDVPKERTEKIVDQSKGHPYSVKLLVSMAVTGSVQHSDFPVFGRTADEQPGKQLLDEMWEILDCEEKNILFWLSLLRIPISPAIGFLCSEKGSKALKLLSNKYIIELNSRGRIFIHDLIREYVLSKAEYKNKHEFHAEIAEQLSCNSTAEISELKEAYYHFHEAGEIKKAVDVILRLGKGFLTLGVETEYIYHILGDAMKTCKGYRGEELSLSRIEFLLLWSNFSEAEELIREIASEADRMLMYGKLNYYMSCFVEASEFYESALKHELVEEERIATCISLALCYNNLGNVAKTEECFNAAQSYQIEKYPLLLAKYYWRYAIFQFDRADVYGAIRSTEKAGEICKKYNAYSPMAKITYNRALFYSKLMDTEKSLMYLDEARQLYEKVSDLNGAAYCHFLAGKIHFQCKRFSEALDEKKMALHLADKYGWTYLHAWMHSDMGEILTRMERYSEAEFHLSRSFDIYETYDNPEAYTILCMNHAILQMILKKTVIAEKSLDKAKEFALNSGQPELLSRYLYIYSMLCELKGSSSKKEKLQKESLSLMKNLTEPAQEMIRTEFEWFRKKIFSEEKQYSVIRYNIEKRNLSSEEIDEVRKSSGEFDLFIDFCKREILVNGKKRNLFRKKVLTAILFELSINPGKTVKTAELFRLIWNRDFVQFEDGSTFRSSISRLRKILDPDEKERFICSCADESGSYFFNDSCNFCIIFKKERD